MKFLVYSQCGETLDLALRLQREGHDVLMHIEDKTDKKIGDGFVKKLDDWYKAIGKGFVWIFDSCSYGKLQDWLRSKGELVFGGCEAGDELENDRQKGQAWFKKAGYKQPDSMNFTDIGAALAHVKAHPEQSWVLKQNGDAPKSINYVGKFENSVDMIYHLEELQKKWNDTTFGKFDCDLMEKVEGLEVAASAFFNGADWIRDDKGKAVGFLNFEEKKETDGGLGETTGEMGTLFKGVDESNKLFAKILLNDGIIKVLKKIGFKGVFDLNGMLLPNGDYVVFEATCRFGVPSTSYELIEAMESDVGELIAAVAAGKQYPVKIKRGWGIVQVLAAKPYPMDSDADTGGLSDGATSIGERIWTLFEGEPLDDWDAEQWKHIHPYNVVKEDGMYKVATKNGYIMTVTASADSIKAARKQALSFIKDSIYFAGMKYRQDIGQRVEDYKV